MAKQSITLEEYVDMLPEERKVAITRLRKVMLDHLPPGFAETMSYGMIGYVVPHSIYPAGYHCDPKQPLPFVNLASQKNFIVLYHMGLYADDRLMKWFVEEYPKHTKDKLDMGKSCIRFKKPDAIPFDLIGELCTKMTPAAWVDLYESKFRKK